METSGESAVSIAGHLVTLALFVNVGFRMLPTHRRFPWPALVFGILLGVPSVLQTWFPPITDALARDPHATLAQGQWWRVLTALAAQDGGLVAAVFNIVVIVLALTLGTWIWGAWRATVLYLVPSIVLNLLAVLFWDRSGGGSSFANDGLMFSVFALALLGGRRDVVRPTTTMRICAGLAVIVAIVLTVSDDAHGVAMLLGLGLGLGAGSRFRRSVRSAPTT